MSKCAVNRAPLINRRIRSGRLSLPVHQLMTRRSSASAQPVLKSASRLEQPSVEDADEAMRQSNVRFNKSLQTSSVVDGRSSLWNVVKAVLLILMVSDMVPVVMGNQQKFGSLRLCPAGKLPMCRCKSLVVAVMGPRRTT